MREQFEFRIPERDARRFLSDDEGVVLGDSVRKVVVAGDDPLYDKLARIDRLVHDGETGFVGYWEVRRKYAAAELRSAEAFHLVHTAYFEPVGEECGTRYDDTDACPLCGVGRRQDGELRLDLRRAPRNKDVAATIAEEWIVSERLADAMRAYGIAGVDLRPVTHAPRARSEPPRWEQLVVTSPPVRAVPPTRFGINPFDDDPRGRQRCPMGHVAGLNVLSEVFVARDDWTGADVAVTREHVGVRRGLLRPYPLLLISPKLRALLDEIGAKGFRLEVSHLR